MKKKDVPKKTLQIGVRIDEQLAKRLREFEEITAVPPSQLARSALEAALRSFERNGEISFPLYCLPQREYDDLMEYLNDFSKNRIINVNSPSKK